MKVTKITYELGTLNFRKQRCGKTSTHEHRFARSQHMVDESQCSRSAHFMVDDAPLCKMHAGEAVLMSALKDSEMREL